MLGVEDLGALLWGWHVCNCDAVLLAVLLARVTEGRAGWGLTEGEKEREREHRERERERERTSRERERERDGKEKEQERKFENASHVP